MTNYSKLAYEARVMAKWFSSVSIGPKQVYQEAADMLNNCADAIEELSKAPTNCDDAPRQVVHPISKEPSESGSKPCEVDDDWLPEGVMMGEPFNDLS